MNSRKPSNDIWQLIFDTSMVAIMWPSVPFAGEKETQRQDEREKEREIEKEKEKREKLRERRKRKRN